ncbi:flagellar hook-associated protein FlgL [Paenibacillus sp. NPDC057967]|uniref:flagellar hook-associated protein FlgL n=1 Tax=Paenibacillus sp. NPDC057967 TaxID=3346293 RepID=UPI0036D805BD
MALRVTPGMMHNNLMRNITHNLGRMENQQYMLSTGRKLNKPSDDPVGITYSLRYRSELAMNEQYDKNISAAKAQLQHTDNVLGQLNEVVQRAKVLVVQALNGTNPQTALDAIAVEIDTLYEQSVMIGNDSLNGKFTFNGQLTDKKPYDAATAETQDSDNEKSNITLSSGISVSVNVTGNEVFGSSSEADNLFKVLKDIKNALTPTVNNTTLNNAAARLDTRYEQIINVRSEMGARTNRVDLIDQRLQDLALNLHDLQGEVEDADMAETIMKFTQEQSVYQASLATGAKIVQPTLIDYLR